MMPWSPGLSTMILLCALSFAACVPRPSSPGPATDNAEMRADQMSIAPSEPSPGDLVEVEWSPPDMVRGQCWVLERREDDTWQHRFHLASSLRGTPPWSPREDGPLCTDIGIANPEPDRLTIPDVATPGLYRLCEVGQEVTRCVEVFVRN